MTCSEATFSFLKRLRNRVRREIYRQLAPSSYFAFREVFNRRDSSILFIWNSQGRHAIPLMITKEIQCMLGKHLEAQMFRSIVICISNKGNISEWTIRCCIVKWADAILKRMNFDLSKSHSPSQSPSPSPDRIDVTYKSNLCSYFWNRLAASPSYLCLKIPGMSFCLCY